MSDIYLSLTETPTVVTLSQPVVAAQVGATVTVGNVVTVALDPASLIALENITVTMGAAVSISNLPSTQTINGSVTANLDSNAINFGIQTFISDYGNFPVDVSSLPSISGTVTANLSSSNLNSVTIGVRGAITANIGTGVPISPYGGINAQIINDEGQGIGIDVPFYVASYNNNNIPISGSVTASNIQTVTMGAQLINSTKYPTAFVGLDEENGSWQAIPLSSEESFNRAVIVGNNNGMFANLNPLPASVVNTVTVGNSVTIGAMPSGALTTRFGTPTTANTAFATSAVTNASRKYLLIQNVTTQSNVITVGIGFTPTTTQGIQLTAGAGITFESSYIPTGAVYVLSSVTASNFTILEA